MTRAGRGVTRESVLKALSASGEEGATWGELDLELGLGHGSVSGALSHLHRAGRIARLRLRRGGSAVYVLTEDVGERQTTERRARAVPQEVLDETYRNGMRAGVDQALTSVDRRLLSIERQLRTRFGTPRLVSKDWASSPLGTVGAMRAHVENLRRGNP